jgi:two-component system, LuxR family, sensor kinase FixL
VRRDGGEIVLYVKDNGIGIDSRHQETIFGLFERLDNNVEGTGFGLALVKRIVAAHDGHLWAESEGHGHGSTFCFTWPKKCVQPKIDVL